MMALWAFIQDTSIADLISATETTRLIGRFLSIGVNFTYLFELTIDESVEVDLFCKFMQARLMCWRHAAMLARADEIDSNKGDLKKDMEPHSSG